MKRSQRFGSHLEAEEGPRDGVHRVPRRMTSQVSVLSRREGLTGTRGRYIGSRVLRKQGRAGNGRVRSESWRAFWIGRERLSEMEYLQLGTLFKRDGRCVAREAQEERLLTPCRQGGRGAVMRVRMED